MSLGNIVDSAQEAEKAVPLTPDEMFTFLKLLQRVQWSYVDHYGMDNPTVEGFSAVRDAAQSEFERSARSAAHIEREGK